MSFDDDDTFNVPSPDDDEIELTGTFLRATEKAYLIRVDKADEWFPCSQILGGNFEPEQLEAGKDITFVISAWLADKKGLA